MATLKEGNGLVNLPIPFGAFGVPTTHRIWTSSRHADQLVSVPNDARVHWFGVLVSFLAFNSVQKRFHHGFHDCGQGCFQFQINFNLKRWNSVPQSFSSRKLQQLLWNMAAAFSIGLFAKLSDWVRKVESVRQFFLSVCEGFLIVSLEFLKLFFHKFFFSARFLIISRHDLETHSDERNTTQKTQNTCYKTLWQWWYYHSFRRTTFISLRYAEWAEFSQ